MNNEQKFWLNIWSLAATTLIIFVAIVTFGHHKGAERIQAARLECMESGHQWVSLAGNHVCIGGELK